MMHRFLALTVIAAFALVGQAKADLVVDGGFEVPSSGASVQTFNAGTTIGGGFTVNSGSVDVVASSFFPAFAGNQSLDLDGSNSGSISQTLATTAGTSYTLSFEYSNNPFVVLGATALATATVSVGGTTSLFTHSGATTANMNYTLFTESFVASSTSTVLTFTSLDPSTSNGGIVLDAVSVNAATVPEPSSLALVGLGSILALARFRGRNAA